MASVTYLREQFSKLQTEEERIMFCYKIVDVEYWSRSNEQKALLPHNFLACLIRNLQAALSAEGRIDIYKRFARIVGHLQLGGYSGYTASFSGHWVAQQLAIVDINKEKLTALLRLLHDPSIVASVFGLGKLHRST
jgi:hypothetical protein